MTADRRVGGDGAAERLDRRDPAQALLDRARDPGRVGAEPGALVGVLGERDEPAGEQRARRLVAGDEQREQEDEELVGRQRPAVDLGAHEQRHEVVAGIAPASPRGAREEGVQLDDRAERLLGRPVGGLDRRVGPAAEVAAVAVGDAEQLGDHEHRERRRELVDGVDLDAGGRPFEDARGQLADPRLEARRRSGGELAVHELPERTCARAGP